MNGKYEISTNSRGEVVASQGGCCPSTGVGLTADEAIKNAERDREYHARRRREAEEYRNNQPWSTYLD